ncbi:hypothetical protein WA158_002295 [Blastocystis sp. Blastoise]
MVKPIYKQNKVLDVVLPCLIFPLMGYLIYFFLSQKDICFTFIGFLVFSFSLQFVSDYVLGVLSCWMSTKFFSQEPFCDPLSKAYSKQKYLSQAYQLVIHVISTYFEFKYAIQYNWFRDFPTMYHAPGESVAVPMEIRLLFAFEITLWIVQAIYLIFIDKRKKDFYALYIHHITTMSLIYFAYMRSWEYGLSVLCIHDITDIFIDILKMMNIMHIEGARCYFILEVEYITTAALWAYARLYKLPLIVVHLIRDIRDYFNLPPFSLQSISIYFTTDPILMLCVFFFCVLISLHIYWFVLLIRLGYRGIVGNNLHSVAKEGYEGASDSSDLEEPEEDQDEEEKKKNN